MRIIDMTVIAADTLVVSKPRVNQGNRITL